MRVETRIINRALSLFGFLVLAACLFFAATTPAKAETGGYPYASYHGPGTNPSKYWWTDTSGSGYSPYGYAYRNCTDFVAWKLNATNKFSATSGYGHGYQWGHRASDDSGTKYGVNKKPTRGAVAWWDRDAYGMSSYGHVAWVESVNGDGTVTIQEYNNPGGGTYGKRTINKDHVSGYIHFKDISSSSSPDPDTQLNGDRMALLSPGGRIYAKDHLGAGGWISQDTTAQAVVVGGDRMALLNPSGRIYAKDHLGVGGWLDQNATAADIAVGATGRMIMITPSQKVYAKDHLGAGGWLDQNAKANRVAVGNKLIALINGCGAVYAKDHLGAGGWVKQGGCGTAIEITVSSTGRIVILTPHNRVYAKSDTDSAGGWIDQNATASQIAAGHNYVALLTPSGSVYAKDHLGVGGWIDQNVVAKTITISPSDRLMVLNASNRVYAKAHLGVGGWLNQNATASAIAN